MPERRVPATVPPQGKKLTGPVPSFPSIEKTYGRPIQEWLDLVAARLDTERRRVVVASLKAEHGMGHGHGNAMVAG